MAVAITDDTGFISAVSDLTLGQNDPVKSSILYNEKLFPNLLNNDLLIAGKFANIPKIWECLWYNNPTRNGYAVGTLCWRNIEDIRDFVFSHYTDIYGYAEENSHVLTKPPRILNISQLNDVDTYEDYVNVLTGWVNEQRTSDPLCMLYDLGDVSNPPQLYVSLIDNNKCPLDDRTAWKPILVTERVIFRELSAHGAALVMQAFAKHMNDYHMGNTPEGINLKLSGYLDADLDNFTFPFSYYINPMDQTIEGMDWPIKFVEKPLVYSENGTDLSGNIVEHQWFRLWKSGYLEHGGTIDLVRHVNGFGVPEVRFDWPVSGLTETSTDGAQLLSRGYLGGFGQTSSLFDDRALCVSEVVFAQFDEHFPGDNLLSVQHSINGILTLNTDFSTREYLEMGLAPVFALSVYPYHLEICPINPNFPMTLSNETSAFTEREAPFPDPSFNVGLQSYLFNADLLSSSFKLSEYDTESDIYPRFISYYATGWSVKYEDSGKEPEDIGEPLDSEL